MSASATQGGHKKRVVLTRLELRKRYSVCTDSCVALKVLLYKMLLGRLLKLTNDFCLQMNVGKEFQAAALAYTQTNVHHKNHTLSEVVVIRT